MSKDYVCFLYNPYMRPDVRVLRLPKAPEYIDIPIGRDERITFWKSGGQVHLANWFSLSPEQDRFAIEYLSSYKPDPPVSDNEVKGEDDDS